MRSSTVSTWPNIIVARGIQSEAMRDIHDFEPIVAHRFQRRDAFADAVDENLAAAAGNGAEAGCFELAE